MLIIILSYQDSCDGMKRTNELAIQCGYQRRTRELADWAKNKRRRYIRREELLSYLAGKPPPPIHVVSSRHHHHHHHHTSPKQQSIVHDLQHSNNGSTAILFGHQHNLNYHQVSADATELHTFKEALARRPR